MFQFNKQTKQDNQIIIGYVVIQALLYLSFLTLDIQNMAPDWSARIKYLAIVLNLVILLWYQGKQPWAIYMKMAAFFTVIADYYLLFTTQYDLGIFFFGFAQICYLFRIIEEKENGYYRKRYWILPLGYLILVFIGVLLHLGYYLALPCYALLLLVNVIFSGILWYQSRMKIKLQIRDTYQMLFVGFVLFACCDLNVALYNMDEMFHKYQQVYQVVDQFAGIAMWLFYLPSQVSIVLSTLQTKESNIVR